jgi:hypothetical protein
MSAAITIPGGHVDLITVDFFAQARCSDYASVGSCYTSMWIGNTLLAPEEPMVFATSHNVNDALYSLGAHAMSRFICLNGGGSGKTYRIYVQGSATVTASFELDAMTLRLTRSHGCANS